MKSRESIESEKKKTLLNLNRTKNKPISQHFLNNYLGIGFCFFKTKLINQLQNICFLMKKENSYS